jgi:protein required for attachment to host cells
MQIAHDTLVMVADGEKLLLFRNEGDEKYPVLETLAHEEAAHAATHEQGSDRPGRSHSSVGERRSGFGQTDWHDQGEQRFARHAAEALDRAAQRCDGDIILVAAPRVLGVMRKVLSSRVAKRVVGQIPKDMVRHETDDVVEAIAAHQV